MTELMPAPPTVRQARRKGNDEKASWLSQGLLTACLALYLLPLVWMIATALKPGGEVFSSGLIGSVLRWSNFTEAWSYGNFDRFILNSLIVSVIGAALVCFTSLSAAYAFARLRFPGRSLVFAVYVATLMIPQEVVVIPMFILVDEIGWVNSYQGLILPWAFTAFGVFLLRQFLLSIPQELEEAARIDGAGYVRTLVTIVLPLVRPAIAVLAVFTFISYWNSFLWPLIAVNASEMSTVPLGLNMFLGQQGNRWELLMAASAISMAPTVIIVILLQRHLVRGIALTGLGGR